MYIENIANVMHNNAIIGWLQMHKYFSKIAFNTGVQIGGKVISILLSFISIALLSRYLGTTGYGNFTLVFTYVSFFSVIADFGLQSTMVREIAFNPENKKLYGNFLLLKLGLIAFSSILATLALIFFPYAISLKIGILIAIIAVAISGLTGYGTVIFQSRVRLDIVTYIDIFTKVVTVGSILVFVSLGLNLYYIIATIFLGNVVGLLVTYVLLREGIVFQYSASEVKRLLILSFPVGLSAFLGLIYFKIDTLMLSVMKNATEVGLYSLAYKILENVLLVWGYYMASVYPLLANLKGKSDYKMAKVLLRNSFVVAIGLGLVTIIIGTIFAPIAINIFGGNAFEASIFALKILLLSLPFLFISNLCSDWFIIHKENKIIFIGITLSVLFNIFCNLFAIPRFGYIGASYITVASAVVQAVYYVTQLVLNFSHEVKK